MNTLVWLDNDLRLTDNAALAWAAQRGSVVCAYVYRSGNAAIPGAASKWWLHFSLQALATSISELGGQLVLRSGPPDRELAAIAKEAGIDMVVWSHSSEPNRASEEEALIVSLQKTNVEHRVFPGPILHDPDLLRTGSGGPYQVFTPFYRRFRNEVAIPSPISRVEALNSPGRMPDGLALNDLALDDQTLNDLALDDLALLPSVDWAEGLRQSWTPGEAGAHERLIRFVDGAIRTYSEGRDVPSEAFTSRLSPHLHFGEISAAQIWSTVLARCDFETAEPFLRQLVWREFAHHLLHHFPHTVQQPLRPKYAGFPWRSNVDGLERWKRGQTGFPIVDAGMRELWKTGWMHNRVRMIVASFLTKDLLVSWTEGAAWFNDTLVDADTANNTLGWQWAAGSGADAQPFFRIFNPVKQGEKFDASGRYVRQWVPEIAALPDRYLHAPWTTPQSLLDELGIKLGTTYPRPVVDHREARDAALEAYQAVRNA